MESAYLWIDGVKFGWGTGLVTPRLAEKIDVLHRFEIDFTFGGTLFEWFYAQGRFSDSALVEGHSLDRTILAHVYEMHYKRQWRSEPERKR